MDCLDRKKRVAATGWRSLSASCGLILVTACGGGGGSPTLPSGVAATEVTITEVTVTGPSMITVIGERAQLAATVRFSDGSTQDQTNAVQWESSDLLVVSVSSAGLVTAAGGGEATVRATFQRVTGAKQLQVLPGPPVVTSDVAGRIENLETVADLIRYHQNAVGWSAFRTTGIITRWDLPIPVYVDAPESARRNVEQALAYWQSVTGLSYVLKGSITEPRILMRAGTDGLVGTAQGRGGVEATYPNNRARRGLAVIRPDLLACSCARLYERVFAGAIGLFDQVAGGGITSGGSRASLREINMIVELYRLPHGARIEPDGSWRVVR